MRSGEWNRNYTGNWILISTLSTDSFSSFSFTYDSMSSQQVVLRPLRLWPCWFHFHRHHHPNTTQLALHHQHQHHHRHLLLLISQQPEPTNTRRFSSLAPSRGILRRANAPLPTTKSTDLPEEEEEEEPKSRNQLKREAKRAVKWGMDLASFSPPQIKLILKVASLDKIVYDALILVKVISFSFPSFL